MDMDMWEDSVQHPNFKMGKDRMNLNRTPKDLLKLCATVEVKGQPSVRYTVAAVKSLDATPSDHGNAFTINIGSVVSLRERSTNQSTPVTKLIVVTSAKWQPVDAALRAQGIVATIFSTTEQDASTEETVTFTTRPIKDESKSKSSGKPLITSRMSQKALFEMITSVFKYLNMDTDLKSALLQLIADETKFPPKALEQVKEALERFKLSNVPKKRTADERLLAGNAADPGANSATKGRRATALQLEGCFTGLLPSQDLVTAIQNICAKTENPLSAQAKIFMVLVLAKKQDIPVQFVLDRLKDVPITDGMLPWNRLKMLVQETEHESKMNKPAATAPVPPASDDTVVDAVALSVDDVSVAPVPPSTDGISVDVVPLSADGISVDVVPPSTDGISVDVVPQSVGSIILDAVAVTVDPASAGDAVWVKARPMIEDTTQAGAADTFLVDAVPVSVVSPVKDTKRRRGTPQVDTQVDPRVDPQVDSQVDPQDTPQVAPDAPRRRKKAKRRRN